MRTASCQTSACAQGSVDGATVRSAECGPLGAHCQSDASAYSRAWATSDTLAPGTCGSMDRCGGRSRVGDRPFETGRRRTCTPAGRISCARRLKSTQLANVLDCRKAGRQSVKRKHSVWLLGQTTSEYCTQRTYRLYCHAFKAGSSFSYRS